MSCCVLYEGELCVHGGNFCPLESVKIYNMGSNGKIYAMVKNPL